MFATQDCYSGAHLLLATLTTVISRWQLEVCPYCGMFIARFLLLHLCEFPSYVTPLTALSGTALGGALSAAAGPSTVRLGGYWSVRSIPYNRRWLIASIMIIDSGSGFYGAML